MFMNRLHVQNGTATRMTRYNCDYQDPERCGGLKVQLHLEPQEVFFYFLFLSALMIIYSK